MAYFESREDWAKRTVANEDYLPWADVQEAKKILGMPADGLTPAEQAAYDALRSRTKSKAKQIS